VVLSGGVEQCGATGRKIQGQGPHKSEDVLAQHHQANKVCKVPNPKNLEAFHKKQQASNSGRSGNHMHVQGPQVMQVAEDTNNSDNSEEEDEDVGGTQRKTCTRQVPNSTKECFFPRSWWKVICHTKDTVLIFLIISDLFPSGEDFKGTDLTKLLMDAIAHFKRTTDIELSTSEDYLLFFDILLTKYYGLQIFTTITRMTSLISSVPSPLFVLLQLWNNISTFRTRIKDKAEVIVAAYYTPDIAKPDFEWGSGQAEAETVALRNMKALVDDGLYHQHGKDENVRQVPILGRN
jgi:hypothetical protein